MKKFITAGLAGCFAVAGLAATAAPADAASGCVTRAEFRHVKHGMTVNKVARIYDTKGRVSTSSQSGGYRFVIRTYRACGQFHVTNVSFDADPGQRLRVSGKTYI